MTMSRSKLFDLVYFTACGAASGEVTNTGLEDDFIGLPFEMGIDVFACWIGCLRKLLADDGRGRSVFDIDHLEKFETIPDAVDHIFNFRSNLIPWRGTESE